METIPQPPAPARNSSTGMFGTKIPSSVAFAVGILLFLLPFAEIKCNPGITMHKSGLQFAIGQKWQVDNNGMNGNDLTENSASKVDNEKEGNAQYFAIAALGLGVIGLLLSFMNAKGGGWGGVITGILSAGALIGVMIEVKKWFNASIAKEAMEKSQNTTDTFGFDKFGKDIGNIFTLNFTPWFYVSLIAFLAAAFFSYQRRKAK